MTEKVKKRKQRRPNFLTVECDRSAIVIRIPHSILPHAVPVAFDERFGFERHTMRIVNAPAFAMDLTRELKDEAENGATLVTDMLDKAFLIAHENGAEGIEGDIK
jgi:hypothetical protein